MAVTIRDIAKETGLSLSTISKYLNHKNIQEKNRILIENAIKRLDYRPNRIAQSLRSEKTKTVAVLMTDLGNYFWGDVVFSITNYFAQMNYTVISCSSNYDIKYEKEMIQYLLAKKVDGVIMLPIYEDDMNYKLLQDVHIPTVVLDQYPDFIKKHPVDVVSSDNQRSGKDIAEYLISHGHKRIGVIAPAEYLSTVRDRISGFEEGCAGRNISLYFSECVELNTEHSMAMNKGKKCFREMIALPQPPTAIFCTNYVVAMGVLVEAAAQNYSIPEDISFVCYDDDMLFRSMTPPITCVAQDLKTIGVEAAKLLLKRMNGDWSDFPILKKVDVSFHERESVGYISD